MILQSLVSYYNVLSRRGEIARPGWTSAKISYALELGPEGRLLSVLPLSTAQERGKKTVMVPRAMELPAAVKRTVDTAANFLWDTGA